MDETPHRLRHHGSGHCVGKWRVFPLGLHLTSNHRLSTRFNAYAAWWSVQIMDQIQGSILDVIRERVEHRASHD